VIQVLTLNANAPVSDPKMAANAEVLAESQDVLMNLILWAYQKRASTAVEPEEGKSRLTVQCVLAQREMERWRSPLE
jgi:hypothetical protein